MYFSFDFILQNLCITRERFHGDNKFRCENCMGLTEAIRKISYPKLPRLLIIQLKRFSGGMEKINSYIPTPFTLQCFCSSCISDHGNQSIKEHEYQLYSVITHVGSTLQAGHYIAYTCSLNQNNIYFDCFKDVNRKDFQLLAQATAVSIASSTVATPSIQTTNSGNPITTTSSSSLVSLTSTTSVMKKIGLGRKKNTANNMDLNKNVKNVNGLKSIVMNGIDNTQVTGGNDQTTGNHNINTGKSVTCPSGLCCGIKMKTHSSNALNHPASNGNENAISNGNNDSTSTNEHNSSRKCNVLNVYPEQFYPSQTNANSIGNSNNSSAGSTKLTSEPIWYMCDDDKIKAIPQHEFREMLLPKKNMITPYLLFYARNDVFESH